ncbi:hypothetical protein P5673_032733 [Acropora cervicornis]|uniref:Integrase catalytic domain-containing protein n=1 Tax=Acropora cervicornis TaxID=6130 RepID=A0AAD9PQX2_ACRCE|nr:hypothetical protein P5673_032733 [Acropora cervicornis]
MNSIWQAIRLPFGFQSTGAHFLDFNNITLAPAERPEDLYQRLMSFIEDNLLSANGNISHHGEVPDSDEENSPTLENRVVLTWLRLVHRDLPSLVKQCYGTELSVDAPIVKTSQQALQADGVTPLVVVGETHFTLSRADKRLTLDALVVEDLDVDALAGSPFMITNDISVRLAKGQVLIQGSEILAHNPESNASSQAHAVRRTQSYVLRSSAPTTVILSWEYLELDIPPNLDPDCTLAMEPPHIVEAVANRVRILNNTTEPRTVRRHEHLYQARHTTTVAPTSPPDESHPSPPHRGGSNSLQSEFFSDAVKVDPDNILPDTIHNQIRQVLQTDDEVVNPTIVGYNGTAGPVQASVNMGPIPLSKASMKYCGVATPFRGIRVYTRSAMGMPGSETALEELMCRVLGDFLQEGCTAKLADDLYCGETSVVRGISTQEILESTKRLPFTSRPAWFSVQHECPDLRRVYAHLKQGTRPSKKLTNIRDVKHYLNITSISKDGLLVVQLQQPLSRPIELIVVPRSVLDGLLTAIHIKLDHPSKNQLQMVMQHHFFALDMSAAITRVSDSCHTCASLKKFPTSLARHSSEDPPEVIGVSFAADIIRRSRRFILLLRECTTSYTASCLASDEKSSTLLDALARLVVGLHPLDGPQAVIWVDPAPGFVSLTTTYALQHLGISVEVVCIKKSTKNPVAERAVLELEVELLRQEPGRGPVTELSLAIATARLNSRLRSSRPVVTGPLDTAKPVHQRADTRQLPTTHLVYVKSDRDKTRARDRYVIVSIDGEWCFIKKFSGSQLRATSYKVKLAEFYTVPHTLPPPSHQSVAPTLDEDECVEIPEQPHPCQEASAPPDLLRPPNSDPPDSTPDQAQQQEDSTPLETDLVPVSISCEPRPQRASRPPTYLQEYILN